MKRAFKTEIWITSDLCMELTIRCCFEGIIRIYITNTFFFLLSTIILYEIPSFLISKLTPSNACCRSWTWYRRSRPARRRSYPAVPARNSSSDDCDGADEGKIGEPHSRKQCTMTTALTRRNDALCVLVQQQHVSFPARTWGVLSPVPLIIITW